MILSLILIVLLLGGGGWWVVNNRIKYEPKGEEGRRISQDLEKYDFDSLRKRGGISGLWEVVGEPKDVNVRRKNTKTNVTWKTSIFRFQSNDKWISGVVNYESGEKRPVIILVRGFAESVGYYPGSGSWKMADELAKNGFATVSIDFLGYGLSEKESVDPLEARFEKVVSVLDLIETVKRQSFVDPNKIGFWAHSNGGQIVLSVLEATGGFYPTVLWAPMTNPFPQSVLETADEGEAGEPIRKMVAEFEKRYDARRYAVENYYQWMNSPIKIFQGTADVWCKVEWQQAVVDKLERFEKRAELDVVEGDDHNFSKNWDEVAEKTVSFFEGVGYNTQ